MRALGPQTGGWLQWFIGFTEGDGAILESKGKLSFVIGQKDVGVLYHIQEVLGFGKVNVFSDKEHGRYVVWDSKHIALLIHLLNGNLVFKLPLNSAWLAGFTDAEGCFNVHITKRPTQKIGFRTKLRFILDQQFSKEGLEEIRTIFNSGHVALTK